MFELDQEYEDEMVEQFQKTLIDRDLRTVFQPIVSLRDGTILGYEALSRGPLGTEMESPTVLFEYAKKCNKLWELEYLCRTRALETVCTMNIGIKIFLNVNPNIMHDIKFRQGFTKKYLKKFDINPERIVFEITEREAIKNVSDFIQVIQNYKDQNYKIAIDDAGAGYSGLNLISDIKPHFIKLDMNLVRDIDKDVTKQSLVRSMSEFASLSNTQLIAEGIETENELLKLIDIGVHYGQGYFLQRPSALISAINEATIYSIKEANMKKNHLYGSRISDIYIKNICKPLRTISSNILVSQAHIMMKEDPSSPGFCVVENDSVLGVITKNELFKILSGQYGYALYANKPIRDIMSTEFIQVDHQTTIDIVTKKAMQRDYDKIYDFITIVKDHKYIGIVTVKELLEKSIEIEILNAKHLNPLSELPGNLLIEQNLEKCLNTECDCVILYFDLDNFKAYNDVYGFENGDRVLKGLTKILKGAIPKSSFIGHIGGDDFLAIVQRPSAIDICESVIDEFDKSILSFYNQDDINKGFLLSKNRNGIEESFPLLSISIAGVNSRDYKTIYEIGEHVGKVKKCCKEIIGSNFMIL